MMLQLIIISIGLSLQYNKLQLVNQNKALTFNHNHVAAFKVLLKNLNQAQISYLERSFGIARKTYNVLLDKQKLAYEQHSKFINQNELKRTFNAQKKVEFPYMYEVSKCVPNEVINTFNSTLSQFFKRRNSKNKIGFPQFKKKGIRDRFRIDNENSVIIHQPVINPVDINPINNNLSTGNQEINSVDIKHKSYITLPLLDKPLLLAEDLSQIFDYKNVKILGFTFSKKAGQYFVSINYELDSVCDIKQKKVVQKFNTLNDKSVGIDLGILNFATYVDSDKNQVSTDTLKTLPKYNALLKLYQSKFSKAMVVKKEVIVNGVEKEVKSWSNNKHRYHILIQKLHKKIHNIKQDYLHKLSNELCRTYKTIKIEDLSVANMMKNHKLARVIQESCFNMFKNMLQYKSNKYGNDLILIDRYFASSKLCHICKIKNNSLELKDRQWTCGGCSTTHHRDINAAINILNYT